MIRLERISKSFAVGDGLTRALPEIYLTIKQGEIFGIIGSSGAGKSTLMRLINLLERPTGGDVLFDGERITHFQGGQLRAEAEDIKSIKLIDNIATHGFIAICLFVSGCGHGRRPIPR
ncbi:ATP-binding cassette domain-containing protein [Rhizobium sp. LjRoot254]|uniref:ATP-binding cassette domain-containing protein n=1 Tax=Rhizobium sp. LjRoot254 TaxID=3342297 RepID=UPI003ECEE271